MFVLGRHDSTECSDRVGQWSKLHLGQHSGGSAISLVVSFPLLISLRLQVIVLVDVVIYIEGVIECMF